MRLEEARWYLEHPTAKIRLTIVAEYCGFCNLSRFAIYYKQRFGEYPVETLQRGKSRHLTSI
jgi:transcriptional regulator GlxA family with amidase domain